MAAFALAVPHAKALEFRDDVGFFQAVRAALSKTTGDKQKSPEQIDAAIRQSISRAVASDHVVDIFAAAGLNRPDISILSDEFLAEVRHMPLKNLAMASCRRCTRQKGNVLESSAVNGSTLRRIPPPALGQFAVSGLQTALDLPAVSLKNTVVNLSEV